MSSPVLELAHEASTTIARLTNCQNLTEANALAVRAAFDVLVSRPGDVRLDLADVQFAGSAGLVELVRLARKVRARGGKLTLANPRPLVREVLALTRLDQFFGVETIAA
jgi:anti-anti-sigma factor